MHGMAAYYMGQKQKSDQAKRSPCTKCGAYHGTAPLEHIGINEDCGHDPNASCKRCNEPVGGLSTDGPDVCVWCASGESRSWNTRRFEIMREPKLVKKDGIFCPACKNDEPEWVRILNDEYKCNSCKTRRALPIFDSAFKSTIDVQFEEIKQLKKELNAAVDHHDKSGLMIEEALCGDGFECENLNISRFEGYARRIKALIKIYNMTEQNMRYLENQVVKGGNLCRDRSFLEQIHIALQGDLSYDKVGAVKKMIEDVLGGSPCEP